MLINLAVFSFCLETFGRGMTDSGCLTHLLDTVCREDGGRFQLMRAIFLTANFGFKIPTLRIQRLHQADW